MEYTIRQATDKDLALVIALFHNTVEKINSGDYTPEQIRAWREKASGERWKELWNSDLSFMVAENSGGAPGGIYLRESAGIYTFHVRAPSTARPFFESRHFVLEKVQKTEICGIELINHLMFKQLTNHDTCK